MCSQARKWLLGGRVNTWVLRGILGGKPAILGAQDRKSRYKENHEKLEKAATLSKNYCRPLILWRIDMQRNAQWSTLRCFPCANWSETRLSTVAFPVPPGDWLDYETIYITKKNWNTLYITVTTVTPGFCWWFGSLSYAQQQMQEKSTSWRNTQRV